MAELRRHLDWRTLSNLEKPLQAIGDTRALPGMKGWVIGIALHLRSFAHRECSSCAMASGRGKLHATNKIAAEAKWARSTSKGVKIQFLTAAAKDIPPKTDLCDITQKCWQKHGEESAHVTEEAEEEMRWKAVTWMHYASSIWGCHTTDHWKHCCTFCTVVRKAPINTGTATEHTIRFRQNLVLCPQMTS